MRTANRMSMPEAPLKAKSKELDLAIDELGDEERLDTEIAADADEEPTDNLSGLEEYAIEDIIEYLKTQGYDVEMDAPLEVES